MGKENSLKEIWKNFYMKNFIVYVIGISLLGSTYSLYSLESDNSLVAYWKFDEKDGEILKDSSSYCNNGKINGATWQEKGLYFDGIDDYVDCGNNNSLNLTDKISIETWVHIPDFPTLPEKRYEEIVCKGAPAYTCNGQYNLAISHSGKTSMSVRNNCGIYGQCSANILIGWHHIVGVYEPYSLTIYIDGFCANHKKVDFSSLHTNDSSLFIGKNQNYNGGYFFKGTIGEMKIYNKALSSSEVKNSFLGKVTKYKPDYNSSDFESYAPAKPFVEEPDPQIASSWKELKKYNLAVVPCPKKIKVLDLPISLNENWQIIAMNKGLDAGVAEINRSLSQNGGTELQNNDAKEKNSIIIGTFDALSKYLSLIENPVPPKPQGYIIRFFEDKNKKNILIAGADIAGARYGCVTLSMLIKQGPVLCMAEVDDWPDFQCRGCFDLKSTGKGAIDHAFRSKMNLVFAGGYWKRYEKMLLKKDYWRKMNQYAKERNVRLMFGAWWDVGDAPYPKDIRDKSCYPYKDMLGFQGRSYSWSKDNLLIAKGKLIAKFMRETGANTFCFHPIDDGGMDDPENWSHRGKPDKEKYKDNQRAEADANVISILSREIKKENPNALVITTIYPYLSYYSKAPHPVKTEMKKLVNLIKDKGILLSSSGKIKDRNLETLCPAVMYINKPYPWSYRLLFSSGGRFAENYYSGNDKDIYWFSRGNFTPAEPVIWAAAEYAWNVKAPGWGTAPNKKNNNIALADANPREITEELLPRICSILFGPQAAMLMAKIYAQNISCYLPVQISQFSGANPRNYFKSKSEAALNAIQWLREAEGKITPTAQKYFISVKNHIQLSYALSEARYRYFNSLKKLSNKNYAGAKLEIQKAVSVLGPVKEHKLAKELMKELNIDPLIEWYHEKNEYVKDIKPLNISCGVYSMDSKTYKGICDGLTNIPGLKIEVFNYPSQKVLADYDVIIFPGTKNIFQGSEIENWRKNIRDFVKRGGGVIFSHNAVGRYSFSDFGKPIFPEICAGYGGQVIDYDNPIFLSVATAHPSVECLRDGEKFKHEYFDHLWIEPGPKAVTILKNDSGNSVMCAGEVGEGRCVYTGEIFGINRKNNIMEPLGIEWKILFNMVRWSAGMNKKIDKGK